MCCVEVVDGGIDARDSAIPRKLLSKIDLMVTETLSMWWHERQFLCLPCREGIAGAMAWRR
ncbi:hypothetical protein HYPDE_30123 [Hyphomicrobium denitrificans 1NES1]|uniref:Uncharacterized protein n=1 Tax=Hyphomicrobium denitrificans 1NES1 TaxID=670307 RepID=N0B2G1_9HYPH|nr:hypothetical protein HYPDE_30123 [Hyphomicrobium denitrificans 1NES1]